LIKDEIERLGKGLASIVADFLKLKSTLLISQVIQLINERFTTELDIDVYKMIGHFSKSNKPGTRLSDKWLTYEDRCIADLLSIDHPLRFSKKQLNRLYPVWKASSQFALCILARDQL
jgi:hypothetical protein